MNRQDTSTDQERRVNRVWEIQKKWLGNAITLHSLSLWTKLFELADRSIEERISVQNVQSEVKEKNGGVFTSRLITLWELMLRMLEDKHSIKNAKRVTCIKDAVYTNMRTALKQAGLPGDGSNKDVLRLFQERLARDPHEERLFEVYRFLPNGCADALQYELRPDCAEGIDRLFSLLEAESPVILRH